MLRQSCAACVAALMAASVVILDAQQRGGGPPGGGRAGGARAGGPRGGGPDAARTGTIEHITVHGRSLEGNLEGDSPDRDVSVYLPPAYAADPSRRFPVVYLLHGYTGKDDTFTDRLGHLQASGDRLAGAQGFSQVIVVTPNAFTIHKGSMYSSSPTTGDWEKYVAEDLVGYIDAHYRTLTARLSRGLAGHSMGGYGALRIGMKRPDVFGSLYAMSACCLALTGDPGANPQMKAAEAITTREQAEELSKQPGFGPSVLLASAAAWSPNPARPPLFLDLPVKDGVVRPEIVTRWNANSPLTMVEQYARNLSRYYAVAIDVGTKDNLMASNRQLHEALARLHVPHYYEEYDGDHTNRVGERLERNVLVFFSKNLVAPSNPTSPQIKD